MCIIKRGEAREIFIPRKKGFYNRYEIRGDTTVIFLEKRTGEIIETFIDTDDLSKLIDLNLAWHALWDSKLQSHYCSACEYIRMTENHKGKYKTHYLHRTVLGITDKNIHIDHRNHNTLDNRKSNLFKSVSKTNTKQRKGKNTNNKSGYRNVCWLKNEKKWVVQLQIEGINTRLGYFDDVHEAGVFAELKRNELYGEFSGLS